MDENKKGKFFKSLLGKDKGGEQQDSQTEQQVQDEPAAQSASEPEPERRAFTPDFTSQNLSDRLYQLHKRWCRYNKKEPEKFLFEDWVKDPVLKDKNPNLEGLDGSLESFRRQMTVLAKKTLEKLDETEKKAKKQAEEIEKLIDPSLAPEPVKVPPDIDTDIHIVIPKGELAAFICIFPPFGDGAPLTADLLNETIERSKVAYGLRQDLVDRIVEEKLYFQIFPLAVGIKPIAGKNGEIIEHIPREEMLTFEEDESGKVDYRDLGLFRNIEEGDLICDIILPDNGTDGMNVKGDTIRAIPGKAAPVPAGNHTEIIDEGTKLVASADGYISYQYGKFRVEDRLVIDGNIDMSVGNQDFLGDIFIKGDVISGFTVEATGSVYISGVVEGATIIAGEDIEISGGMNGNNHGVLRAGRSIHCAFLENAKVYATGDVTTQSIITCDVFCNGSLYVDDGIGVIIGGTMTVGKTLSAKTIGCKSFRKTEIFLGIMPELRTEKEEKEEELKNVKKTQDLLEKNIRFLKAAGSLNEERAALLKQLVEQEELYRKMKKRLEEDIENFNRMANDFSRCVVKGGMVYPPTKVTIGGDTYLLETATAMCKFFLADDGHVMLGIN